MTYYDGSKTPPHLFPRVHHLTDDCNDFEHTPETMIVNDAHDVPYIGDFPPKDDYSEHHFY